MNHDELISRYIDGELSPQEDRALREMISADPELSREYQFALDLHFACAVDGKELEPPVDFALAVEDMILSRMEQANVKKTRPSLAWTRKLGLAFTVLFLIVSQISDYEEHFHSRFFGLDFSQSVQSENTSGSQQTASPKKSANIAKRAVIQKSENFASAAEDDFASVELSDTTTNAVEAKDSVAPKQAVKTIIAITPSKKYKLNENIIVRNADIALARPNATLTTLINTPVISNNIDESIEKSSANTQVSLASFLGSDFAKSGFSDQSKNVIKHISQSIGYTIGDKDAIGIEFGVSEYVLTENTQYSKPVNYSISSVVTSSNKKGGASILGGRSLSSPQNNSSDFQTTTFSFQEKKQSIWGAAYYQRSAFQSANFSINGRVGLGMSSYGPLSFGKLFASYKVLPFMSFMFGAEGRAFNGNMQSLSSDKAEWNTSAAFIYGIQAQF